ncbi:hypothetical protein NE237_018976 [Protea cynaroides]|uniref:Uncharacterized protein n=1 Tax=Protea cynaroides TaxID=273540 RepID=A0A9Q0KAX3_9MAGN|nr:hypothetical protein NE237_018976 [Protea cynaroides]
MHCSATSSGRFGSNGERSGQSTSSSTAAAAEAVVSTAGEDDEDEDEEPSFMASGLNTIPLYPSASVSHFHCRFLGLYSRPTIKCGTFETYPKRIKCGPTFLASDVE